MNTKIHAGFEIPAARLRHFQTRHLRKHSTIDIRSRHSPTTQCTRHSVPSCTRSTRPTTRRWATRCFARSSSAPTRGRSYRIWTDIFKKCELKAPRQACSSVTKPIPTISSKGFLFISDIFTSISLSLSLSFVTPEILRLCE